MRSRKGVIVTLGSIFGGLILTGVLAVGLVWFACNQVFTTKFDIFRENRELFEAAKDEILLLDYGPEQDRQEDTVLAIIHPLV